MDTDSLVLLSLYQSLRLPWWREREHKSEHCAKMLNLVVRQGHLAIDKFTFGQSRSERKTNYFMITRKKLLVLA